MPRGFKKDLQATRERKFWDKDSFISLPKVVPGCSCTPGPHVLLCGEDKAEQRNLIFLMQRIERGGGKWDGVNFCEKCGKTVYELADEMSEVRGQWHHKTNKPGMRCDCVGAALILCPACHRKQHVHVQFGKSKLSEKGKVG